MIETSATLIGASESDAITTQRRPWCAPQMIEASELADAEAATRTTVDSAIDHS